MSKVDFQKNKQSGFSLIELLTAISIIVILTSLFLANYRAQGSKAAVNAATSNLISDLHKVQSFALSSRDVASGNPASRYSITFSNGAISYDLVGYNSAIPAVPTTISTTRLGPLVSVSSVQITRVDGSVVSPNSVNAGFKIPFGKVVLNFTGSVIDEVNDLARIKLISADNTVCSYVVINGITGNIVNQTPCP